MRHFLKEENWKQALRGFKELRLTLDPLFGKNLAEHKKLEHHSEKIKFLRNLKPCVMKQNFLMKTREKFVNPETRCFTPTKSIRYIKDKVIYRGKLCMIFLYDKMPYEKFWRTREDLNPWPLDS